MVKAAFDRLGKPVRVVPGNHDHASAKDRKAYEKVFPDSLNYVFSHRGWQIIGLDTCEGTNYSNTLIQPETLTWLDRTLPELDREKPTIALTHFPLGAGVTYRPKNAEALLERFLKFNLKAVFSGHYHGFTENLFGKARLTTNRCCALRRGNHDGTPEKGYFHCSAAEGEIKREFVRLA